MSLQEETKQDVSTTLPLHKVLPSVRKQLLAEFDLSKECLSFLENKLGQEPYNLINNRDGQRVPSTRWTIMLEQLWKINNRAEDFVVNMTFKGRSFNRRKFIVEPVFKNNLMSHIREQIKGIGYHRVFFNDVTRSTWVGDNREEYKTLQLKIPV